MLRILYVEDDEIATSIGKSMLGLFKEITVQHAATGYGALDIYSPGTFDLLLIDLGLPDISGLELVKMIKNQYSCCPPVVAITAHVNPNDAKPADISRIYTKPLTYELVQEILNCFG
jgi:two-component system, OmpR family, aerobic respiration control sensor histidine kinase ArcB